MNQLISRYDIEEATDIFINRYKISTQLINRLLGVEQQEILKGLLDCKTAHEMNTRKVEYLLYRSGANIFAGSHEAVKQLREKMIQTLDDQTIEELYGKLVRSGNDTTRGHKIGKIMGCSWSKNHRQLFFSACGFPDSFSSGYDKSIRALPFFDVEPLSRIPALVEYQVLLKDKMRDILNLKGDKTRCMVTLPTGGGKTRVAMEAFIDFVHPRFSEGKYMIWIAQSEELCEQAISCLQTLWSQREFTESLRIYRYFGSYGIEENAFHGGVLVSSINKIYNSVKTNNPFAQSLLQKTSALIIDEAHRSTSNMYKMLFDKTAEYCSGIPFPVCGLTATPGRSYSEEDNRALVNTFQAELIKPELGEEYEKCPLDYFRANGYLSKATHIVVSSGIEYELKEDDLQRMNNSEDLPNTSDLLKKLARDEKRNQIITTRLRKIPNGNKAIVYACSVEHAQVLSCYMNMCNRKSAWVSADTSSSERRSLIETFKSDYDLEFLFNFGVLTTGFDAPKTNYVIMCRPTTSPVLYEQIIGRGLRGPKFGGTETCTVIDFTDNLLRLDFPQAYTRFQDQWVEDVIE